VRKNVSGNDEEARLAEYLKAFSIMPGNEDSVRIIKVGEGSTNCIADVEDHAYPKVQERLKSR